MVSWLPSLRILLCVRKLGQVLHGQGAQGSQDRAPHPHRGAQQHLLRGILPPLHRSAVRQGLYLRRADHRGRRGADRLRQVRATPAFCPAPTARFPRPARARSRNASCARRMRSASRCAYRAVRTRRSFTRRGEQNEIRNHWQRHRSGRRHRGHPLRGQGRPHHGHLHRTVSRLRPSAHFLYAAWQDNRGKDAPVPPGRLLRKEQRHHHARQDGAAH